MTAILKSGMMRGFARYIGRKSGAHQAPNATRLDRYPLLFADAAARMPNPRRILSYGCSTGEECWTLRRYFPSALVIGADINPLNVTVAKMRNADPMVMFTPSNDAILRSLAPFDAIFCLAVLTRAVETRDLDNCKDVYPFALFSERISFFDSILSDKGILAVHGATYRFSDTPESVAYDAIPTREPPHDSVKVFDRNSNRLDTQPACSFLYRKAGACRTRSQSGEDKVLALATD